MPSENRLSLRARGSTDGFRDHSAIGELEVCNLSHEEWIPAGPGMHEARELLGTLSARDLRDQVSGVFDTDARQREALHADTGELAEGLPHAGSSSRRRDR